MESTSVLTGGGLPVARLLFPLCQFFVVKKEAQRARLFVRPERLIDAIRAEHPDVVALSYYVWNTNLNDLVFRLAKEAHPAVLNVGGGPNITDLNGGEAGGRRFFATQKSCDVFVINQ